MRGRANGLIFFRDASAILGLFAALPRRRARFSRRIFHFSISHWFSTWIFRRDSPRLISGIRHRFSRRRARMPCRFYILPAPHGAAVISGRVDFMMMRARAMFHELSTCFLIFYQCRIMIFAPAYCSLSRRAALYTAKPAMPMRITPPAFPDHKAS